jgi:hypothetical protein
MAKRVRGSSTRPGQRARLQRSTQSRGTTSAASASAAAASAPTTRPAGLTSEEEARAAALEAAIVAEEKAAEETARKGRDRARRGSTQVDVRTGTLAVQAAEEYAYVARDLRRITLIGGSLIAFLLGLWVVVQVTGITL